MKKVLSFGEILLRLSPDVDGKWIDAHTMPAHLGGAELNVANALARWNIPVAYCSAAPDNYLTAAILNKLSNCGIDTTRMVISGDRIGIYYLAQGSDLKNTSVIYDRANSSSATLQPGQADWNSLFDGISWFHFSAISPAVTENLANVCEEALITARQKGITISVDLNYRAKLWKWGKQPVEVMPRLVKYCNVVMGNIWAIENMLGIKLKPGFDKDKEHYILQAEESSYEVLTQFPSCTHVANTFRFDHGNGIQYYSTLCSKEGITTSDEYEATDIVDKVGSGDCFMAGLIYGMVKGLDKKNILEFATAAAVDKMYIVGDATTSSVDHIMKRKK